MDPIADRLAQGAVSRRNVVVRLGGGALAALLLAAAQSPLHLAAQDATPAAVGVTAQAMGVGQPTTAPGLELSLRRVTIAPDGSIPAHSHPGALVIFVEAGTFGYTSLGGTAHLTRAAAEGATPTATEAMPIGTEVLLNPGDWLFTEDPQDDVRNAGEDDVIVLVAGLTQVGEPFTTFL